MNQLTWSPPCSIDRSARKGLHGTCHLAPMLRDRGPIYCIPTQTIIDMSQAVCAFTGPLRARRVAVGEFESGCVAFRF